MIHLKWPLHVSLPLPTLSLQPYPSTAQPLFSPLVLSTEQTDEVVPPRPRPGSGPSRTSVFGGGAAARAPPSPSTVGAPPPLGGHTLLRRHRALALRASRTRHHRLRALAPRASRMRLRWRGIAPHGRGCRSYSA
jgi:hypothetical protein